MYRSNVQTTDLPATERQATAASTGEPGPAKNQRPVLARRLITLVPALAVLMFAGDPTKALVWSQVVLSFGIPFALVPLLWLTSRRDLMGAWVNRRTTTLAGAAIALVIIALNGYLLTGL